LDSVRADILSLAGAARAVAPQRLVDDVVRFAAAAAALPAEGGAS
jgi:hypothetical protein